MTTSERDIFKPTRDFLDQLKRTIAEETQRAQPFIDRCIAEGDYEGAKARERHLAQSFHHIHAEIRRIAALLPPFVSERDGVIFLHQVTPENEHIFREMIRA